MSIASFEKVSLQDYPGKISSICFINGCQLRCPYCHNPDLVLPEIYGDIKEDMTDSFIEYLQKRKNMLQGVVISGGEPLMEKNLKDLIYKIKEMGLAIKLDSNGMAPDRLQDLIDENLIDYIALDYKASWTSFERSLGLGARADGKDLYESWKKSLDIVARAGLDYELRTTIVREIHTRGVLIDMAKELKDLVGYSISKWFLQSFEERGEILNHFTKAEKSISAYSKEEMGKIKNSLDKIVSGVCLRNS